MIPRPHHGAGAERTRHLQVPTSRYRTFRRTVDHAPGVISLDLTEQLQAPNVPSNTPKDIGDTFS